MKITSFKIRNYRTLESIELTFPSWYAAICGANDSGKTNVVRAVRALMREESNPVFVFEDKEELSLKDDYPKWKDAESGRREIAFELAIALSAERDVGFYQFVTKQLSIPVRPETLELVLEVKYRADKPEW